MTLAMAPGTGISWAHSSGTALSPIRRAAAAGNSASRSGVSVKMQLTRSPAPSSLRSSSSCISASVASRIASAALAATVLAPLSATSRMRAAFWQRGPGRGSAQPVGGEDRRQVADGVTAAIGTSTVSRPRVPERSPAAASQTAAARASRLASTATKARKKGTKRSARRSRRSPEARGAATAATSRAGGRPDSARATTTSADSALTTQDEDGHDEAERRPAAQLAPPAVGPDAERDRQRRLRQRVGDLVEIDAGRRALVLPARELAVDAVEQELQLDQDDRPERGREARAG